MRFISKSLFIISIITLPLSLGGFLFFGNIVNAGNTELLSSEISGNGQFVIFTSPNKLIESDNNNLIDVYLRDATNNQIELISKGIDGQSGNRGSYFPSISNDGRYISFTSSASNLIEGDSNIAADVFLFDRSQGGLQRIGNGNSDAGISVVSNDGNIIAFRSTANNLTSASSAGVFLYNRVSSVMKQISRTQVDNQKGSLAMSGSGKQLAYLAPDTNSVVNAFLYDLATASVNRVSVGLNNSPANGSVDYVDISNNGNLVVWSSAANNIIAQDLNNRKDIFLYDLTANKSSRLIESFAEVGSDAINPRIAGDGSAVIFESKSDFTIGSGLTEQSMVYRLGLKDNVITRMSSNKGGNPDRLPAEFPSISDDGLLSTFLSSSDFSSLDIVSGQVNNNVMNFSGSPVEPLPISDQVATTGLFANLAVLVLLRPFLTSPNFLSGIQSGVSRLSDLGSTISSYQLYYYRYVLNFLSLIGLRKKRKVWGTVYDSNNKQPLDPAVVELIDKSGNVIERAITDLAGRFGFIAVSGNYKLRASKTNYVFPSKVHANDKDEFYENLYRGEPLTIKDKSTLINPNIPMDPTGFDWNQAAKQKLFNKHAGFTAAIEIISKMLFWFGFGFSIVNFFLHFNAWTIAAVIVYVVILIFKLIAVEHRLWGKLYISEQAPVRPVRLELAEFQMGVIMGKALTAPDGKFFLKSPQPGEFKLTIKYDGEKMVLWEGNVVVSKNCVYNEDIKL